MKGIPPTPVRIVIGFSFVNLPNISPPSVNATTAALSDAELFYQKGFHRCGTIRPQIDQALKSCTSVTSECPTTTSGHAKLDESFKKYSARTGHLRGDKHA